MANNLNQNPIFVDTSFVSWRASQTLNTGTSPNGAPAQPGIRVMSIAWSAPGPDATFVITDPNSGITLFRGYTDSNFTGPDPFWSFDAASLTWRDFSVTLSTGVLLIYYR
jgi:hypothetical protein